MITFKGPEKRKNSEGLVVEAVIPNPDFDPDEYYVIRGEKQYWEKPEKSVANVTFYLDGDTYRISQAWTTPSYRRQGLIKKLYEMIWQYAKRQGKGFSSGWVQSPLMAKYWEDLEHRGLAESYAKPYNTTGKGWRRLKAAALRRAQRDLSRGTRCFRS